MCKNWYVFVVCSTVDIPEESPSLSHVESSRDAEEVIPQAESLDSEICQAIKNHSVGPHRASSSASFSSRLSEIDAKLIELQQIADYLEKDFSNSRMVHTVFLCLLCLNFLMTACNFQ